MAELYVSCTLMTKHSVKHIIHDYWKTVLSHHLFLEYTHLTTGISCSSGALILKMVVKTKMQMRDRRYILSTLKGKYNDFYVTGQKLVISKLLVLLKGCLALKQYIPPFKHQRFGLILCSM